MPILSEKRKNIFKCFTKDLNFIHFYLLLNCNEYSHYDVSNDSPRKYYHLIFIFFVFIF